MIYQVPDLGCMFNDVHVQFQSEELRDNLERQKG